MPPRKDSHPFPPPTTVKLIGPKEITPFSFEQDGVKYQVQDGTVVPDLPAGKVPPSLFGLGFTEAEPDQLPLE